MELDLRTVRFRQKLHRLLREKLSSPSIFIQEGECTPDQPSQARKHTKTLTAGPLTNLSREIKRGLTKLSRMEYVVGLYCYNAIIPTVEKAVG